MPAFTQSSDACARKHGHNRRVRAPPLTAAEKQRIVDRLRAGEPVFFPPHLNYGEAKALIAEAGVCAQVRIEGDIPHEDYYAVFDA